MEVAPARLAPVAQRMRGAVEDLADVAESRPASLLAVAATLRARARDLRSSPGGMYEARAADGLARITEYLVEDARAVRAAVRGKEG